jgi:hypothetical protein
MSKSYAYVGDLGSVIENGFSFDAWSDGFWIGVYDTLDEAVNALTWREKIKLHRPLSVRHDAAQILGRQSKPTR